MSSSPDKRCYVGIDVGTGSARVGVFDGNGKMLATATREIRIWRPEADFVEQSSADIWRATCAAVKQVLADAGVKPAHVRGLGFDATCSLVVLDADDQPVTVSPTGNDEQNIIVWMDHRAMDQMHRTNATRHDVLKYVGGTISPEMQSPKLLWLKEILPQTWQRAARFFDLPDWLVYRATGHDTRSLCSTVCKWTYLGHEQAHAKGSVGRWEDTFFRQVGLADFVDEGYRRIGTRVRPMGEPVGKGLTEKVAAELGLRSGTPVGVSIIDAHAGGLGLLGAPLDGKTPTQADLETRLALIGGTSSCHMTVSRDARFIPGVWGPYYSAMIPGMWLTEGGQSATGAMIDHVIFGHARAAELQQEAKSTGQTVYELLNQRLDKLAQALVRDEPLVRDSNFAPAAQLTRELHVLPYFHGNRSPRADATLRGMISGLTLGDTTDDLARLYLATIQAIAHGTRHIIDTLNAQGYRIETVFACGGGTKNPVFLREHADITGCTLILPREPEAVLLGSAILGAVASGDYGSVLEAMTRMNVAGEAIGPAGGNVKRYHDAKHRVFQRMYDDFMSYHGLMKS
ncbi:MAG TPA: FGGY-family carbohydrate kinase [Phycisphaerae bacterium]|nr:FGGY-family carbohydrate kinase [Phycisphaerae bacterium]